MIFEVVNKLLDLGADPLKKDKQKRTPLEVASSQDIVVPRAYDFETFMKVKTALRNRIGRIPKLDKLVLGMARVSPDEFRERMKEIAKYVSRTKKGKWYLECVENIAQSGGKWALEKLQELSEEHDKIEEVKPKLEIIKKLNILVMFLGGFEAQENS